MAKILRVIDPFFEMEIEDTFILSEDGKYYNCERSEEFHKGGDGDELNAAYSSTFRITPDYAKQLIKDGYLEEVNPETKKFVNVFDEIDNLIERYNTELSHIDVDLAGEPQCLKVEKTTVLTNILSVLNHLKNLRK